MGLREFVYKENYTPKANVKSTYKPITYVKKGGCWECVSHAGSVHRGNYPVINRNKRFYRLSRYIYEQEYGSIPVGMYIMHLCDNPKCINPKHLKAGTPKENTADMINKGRKPLGVKVSCAKLNDELVLKILSDSRPHSVIASEFGVSKRAIQKVKSRQTWKHVSIN